MFCALFAHLILPSVRSIIVQLSHNLVIRNPNQENARKKCFTEIMDQNESVPTKIKACGTRRAGFLKQIANFIFPVAEGALKALTLKNVREMGQAASIILCCILLGGCTQSEGENL